jgi:hypothetical protein
MSGSRASGWKGVRVLFTSEAFLELTRPPTLLHPSYPRTRLAFPGRLAGCIYFWRYRTRYRPGSCRVARIAPLPPHGFPDAPDDTLPVKLIPRSLAIPSRDSCVGTDIFRVATDLILRHMLQL